MLTFKGSTRYLRFQNTVFFFFFFKGVVNDYYLYKYNNLIYLYFCVNLFLVLCISYSGPFLVSGALLVSGFSYLGITKLSLPMINKKTFLFLFI